MLAAIVAFTGAVFLAHVAYRLGWRTGADYAAREIAKYVVASSLPDILGKPVDCPCAECKAKRAREMVQ